MQLPERATLDGIRAGLEELTGRPRLVLGGLVVVQWLLVGVHALRIQHNGWLFFQGGDQTWYYTTAWALGDWSLTMTHIGFGWPYLLAPIAAVAGPNFLTALPAIVLFQVVALLPLALLATYGICAEIGGRLLGYLAAALWVLVPFAAIPLFDPRYHVRYAEEVLPHAFGLTGMADFPATVAVLGGAYFLVRSLRSSDLVDPALAGALAGFAIGIKPSTAPFVAAALAGLAAARRFRFLGAFAVALLPAILTLAIWKERGLGYLPAFLAPEERLAAGLLAVGLPGPIERYLDFDWGHLARNLDHVREFFWSVRILEWLVLAGLLALGRRSVPAAVFVAVWFLGFLLVKGTNPVASVESGSFFRLMLPAYPAMVVFLAALPLLLPRRGKPWAALPPPSRTPRGAVVVAAIVLVAGPLAAAALAPKNQRPVTLLHLTESVFLTVDERFGLELERVGKRHVLRWRAPAAGSTEPFYTVYRMPFDDDTICEDTGGAAVRCLLNQDQIGYTTRTQWSERLPPGTWTYRVALSANARKRAAIGDAMMLSLPLTVRVP